MSQSGNIVAAGRSAAGTENKAIGTETSKQQKFLISQTKIQSKPWPTPFYSKILLKTPLCFPRAVCAAELARQNSAGGASSFPPADDQTLEGHSKCWQQKEAASPLSAPAHLSAQHVLFLSFSLIAQRKNSHHGWGGEDETRSPKPRGQVSCWRGPCLLDLSWAFTSQQCILGSSFATYRMPTGGLQYLPRTSFINTHVLTPLSSPSSGPSHLQGYIQFPRLFLHLTRH